MIPDEMRAPDRGGRPPRRLVRSVLLGAWLLAVGLGLCRLWGYAGGPGIGAEAPVDWPPESGLFRSADRWSLVFFAHPRCPCTRASVRELQRLVASAPADLSVQVLVYRPAHAEDAWERTDLWESAATIQGAKVAADGDAAEAFRFGVRTSGQVLLYDPAGRLAFRGGITPARGHSGDSIGRSSILALLAGDQPSERETQVFGCALAGDMREVP